MRRVAIRSFFSSSLQRMRRVAIRSFFSATSPCRAYSVLLCLRPSVLTVSLLHYHALRFGPPPRLQFVLLQPDLCELLPRSVALLSVLVGSIFGSCCRHQIRCCAVDSVPVVVPRLHCGHHIHLWNIPEPWFMWLTASIHTLLSACLHQSEFVRGTVVS